MCVYTRISNVDQKRQELVCIKLLEEKLTLAEEGSELSDNGVGGD